MEQDQELLRSRVSEGSLYELRFLIADPQGDAPHALDCKCQFWSDGFLLSEEDAFPLEVFSGIALQAVQPEILTGSRFFRAPPHASELTVVSGARIDHLQLNISLARVVVERSLAALQAAVVEMNDIRRSHLQQVGAWTEDLERLLTYGQSQLSAIEPAAARGKWEFDLVMPPSPAAEISNFDARISTSAKSNKPPIALVGSERLFCHLMGEFCPIIPSRSDPFLFIDAMPVALILERTTNDVFSDWCHDFFPPDGELSELALEMIDRAKRAGISIVLYCKDAGLDESGLSRLIDVCDTVVVHGRLQSEFLARWPEAAHKLRAVSAAVDRRLLAPIPDSASTGLRILFPCGTDLFEVADARSFCKKFAGDQLVVTDVNYSTIPHRMRQYLGLNDCRIVNCNSYFHACKLYRNADVVILFERSQATPGMQAEIVVDAIASGSVVLYIGDPEQLGDSARLVKVADTPARAFELLDLLNDWLYRESAWLASYRLLAQHHDIDCLAGALDLGEKTSPAHDSRPLVTVVASTKRPSFIPNILENFDRQVYPNKELIIVINHDLSVAPEFGRDDVRVFVMPDEFNIGYCLNYGRRRARGSIWFKFDDDDLYASNYLLDMVNVYHYSGADAVGKPQAFVYFERNDTAIMRAVARTRSRRWLGNWSLCGATLSGRTSVDLPAFSQRIRRGNDSDWVQKAGRRHRLIFGDALSFVVRRYDDEDHHTWRADEQDLTKGARVLSACATANFLSRSGGVVNEREWS